MTPSQTSVELTEIIFPEHCNHYGTLFAGNGLLLMSKAAFLAARNFADSNMVIVKCSDAEFLAPVPQGRVLTLHAEVTRVGRTSLTVTVSGHSKDLGGLAEPVLKAQFEMVAVDAQGKPQEITKSITS
ncbi:Acyl-CoA hydrolase [Polynucleobacter meluiroseus]|uniref:Acyl-CoA hydrolase n=1 Tax=Polynucleobacter meluiroseus TaxID=1938814 RepID=A0A240E3Z2_9BURK|nr:acyl-CoA thioesterase [Polynucleobacter meluiroseus]SNX29236.1 Acyl-CoA hydrolase [Polynucleobacter meluiroseus]